MEFAPFEIKHLPWRGALVADLLAVRQLTLGEDRRDVVEFLDLPGVERKNIAGRHQLLQREIFGVEHVERIRLGDHALGHVIGRRRDVFDLDAGIFEALLRDVVALVHRRAEIAQHLRIGGMDIGKSGNGAGACGKADRAGGALQHGATADAIIEFRTIAHGHLQRCQAAFSGDGTVTELRVEWTCLRLFPGGENALADTVIGGVELVFRELGRDLGAAVGW